MHPDTARYNAPLDPGQRELCDLLAREIDGHWPARRTGSGTAIRSGSWRATPSSVTAGRSRASA